MSHCLYVAVMFVSGFQSFSVELLSLVFNARSVDALNGNALNATQRGGRETRDIDRFVSLSTCVVRCVWRRLQRRLAGKQFSGTVHSVHASLVSVSWSLLVGH